MYVERNIQPTIEKYLDKPEIIAVIGPRQCGKTTLLKAICGLCENSVFLDFEDREILDLFNNDIKAFYALHLKNARFAFIDEFQYAHQGGRQLKYLYDHHQLKIIISGSSALDLTNQAIKFLVGRIFVFHLYPFNFAEYLSCQDKSLYDTIYLDIKKETDDYLYGDRQTLIDLSTEVAQQFTQHYHDYAVYGGYPRVALAQDAEEKQLVIKNIYNTYFLREIRDILQLSSEEGLDKLIKALAHQVGSLVSYDELCQLTHFNYHQLKNHLSILEKTYVIKQITPFFTNKRLELVKTPKLFFYDNGFRNHAANYFQPFATRGDRGLLNENFVAGQLIKSGLQAQYWRTKSDAEVDFVVEFEHKKLAIETKSTLHKPKAGKALLSFKNKYKPHKIVVLSETFLFLDSAKKIAYLPIYLI